MIVVLPSAEDADDLYYDSEHKRVYVPGGEGLIYVFKMNDPDHYRLLSKIPLHWVDGRLDILDEQARACIASF
jgi:hypothetical protein